MVKILVVDDSNFERMVTVKLFLDYGFEVDEAINPEQATEKFASHDYDLVVLDILMEGKDGIELLSEMKQKKKGVKFLLLSSLGEDELAELAKANDADAYISKPVSSIKVEDAMNALGYS